MEPTDGSGAEVRELGTREARALLQRWREHFAPRDARRGIPGQFLWHVYSYGRRQHSGAQAYRRAAPSHREFYVLTLDRKLAAWHWRGAPPELHGQDVAVVPLDFSWSMAFTHEESMGLGPYFALPDPQADPGPE